MPCIILANIACNSYIECFARTLTYIFLTPMTNETNFCAKISSAATSKSRTSILAFVFTRRHQIINLSIMNSKISGYANSCKIEIVENFNKSYAVEKNQEYR